MAGAVGHQSGDDSFTAFARKVGPRLRMALIAAYGPDMGPEAVAEALAYGWEHWDRIETMDNAAGYLYKVALTKARRSLGRSRSIGFPPPRSGGDTVWVEPGLPDALHALPERQRQAVLLIHGYGWTQNEVADLWGAARTTVQGHVERGLAQLRQTLGVDHDE